MAKTKHVKRTEALERRHFDLETWQKVVISLQEDVDRFNRDDKPIAADLASERLARAKLKVKAAEFDINNLNAKLAAQPQYIFS